MTAIVCEPLKDKVLLSTRLKELKPKRCLVIFWHGVGDLVMFMAPLQQLRRDFPDTQFDLGTPLGLGYKDIYASAVELTGDQVNNTAQDLPYDLVAKITFPMNEYEGQHTYTKGELCCATELGIDPCSGHLPVRQWPTRLVCVHFQITCLPECCNPDRDTAEKIWNDVLAEGFVPIECHFQHIFHNPVNTKFDFIDATVRRCRPELGSLIGLISHAAAFIGVVSGPFHIAAAMLPPERVMLLEKDFKLEHFTKVKLARANLRDYKNEVRDFLKALSK